MKPNEWNVYARSMRPSVHTAPMIASQSSITSEPLNRVTTELLPSNNEPSWSNTPSQTNPREWRGFSEYEIAYGVRAAGGL